MKNQKNKSLGEFTKQTGELTEGFGEVTKRPGEVTKGFGELTKAPGERKDSFLGTCVKDFLLPAPF